MYRIFLFPVLFIITVACDQQLKNNQSILNIDSLVNAQSIALTRSNAELQKQLTMNGSAEEMSYQPDSLNWITELDILKQLSIINKPIYRDLYVIEDDRTDTESNLTVRTYSTEQVVPVRTIKFYYRSDFKNLRRITATYIEKNSLYESARTFNMEFSEEAKSVQLKQISITGYQKMVLSDSVIYSLHLTIVR